MEKHASMPQHVWTRLHPHTQHLTQGQLALDVCKILESEKCGAVEMERTLSTVCGDAFYRDAMSDESVLEHVLSCLVYYYPDRVETWNFVRKVARDPPATLWQTIAQCTRSACYIPSEFAEMIACNADESHKDSAEFCGGKKCCKGNVFPSCPCEDWDNLESVRYGDHHNGEALTASPGGYIYVPRHVHNGGIDSGLRYRSANDHSIYRFLPPFAYSCTCWEYGSDPDCEYCNCPRDEPHQKMKSPEECGRIIPKRKSKM